MSSQLELYGHLSGFRKLICPLPIHLAVLRGIVCCVVQYMLLMRYCVPQVSEKIVLLDDEARKLKAREADFESRVEMLTADKAALLTVQEELRAEVTEKMTLLDEFEDRFQRQYK